MRSLALLVQRQALLAQELQQGKREDCRLTAKLTLLDQRIQCLREFTWLVDVDGLPAFLPSHIAPQRPYTSPSPVNDLPQR